MSSSSLGARTANRPRFLRIGRHEIMCEVAASPFKPSTWFRPATVRTDSGDWLAWAGPLHIAVSPWVP